MPTHGQILNLVGDSEALIFLAGVSATATMFARSMGLTL